MNQDISHILREWPRGDDDEISARLIDGENGSRKIQMRIDLGILQLERDGSPDGSRPGGFESLLELFEHRQHEHAAKHDPAPFTLSTGDVKALRDESVRYYYRYLSLMKLGDFERVVRDATRNLRLFAFVRQYAARELDRWVLDQYRPYVIMVLTQARVSILLSGGAPDSAGRIVNICDAGIADIISFYNEYGLTGQIDDSLELSILKTLRNQFIDDVPETLEDQLSRAISEERFEDAARIRDEIGRRP